mgnify:CR=1 FL=1
MQSIEHPAEMAAWTQELRSRGETVALVPTMGFLHEGHLSLMRRARERADHLVVSIFVNPLQFGPGEDLERYPRDPDGDAERCREVGTDVLFLPSSKLLYPDGFQTTVQPGALALSLCGASRPGHFDGVATVVLKLFNIVSPDVAVFGRKDYQQLQILRRMGRDLDLPVEILGMPIVREVDGIAMSSRNAYLSPAERLQAQVLHQALDRVEASVAGGERSTDALVQLACSLVSAQPLAEIDYVELVDAESLPPTRELSSPALLALAVRFGGTRLIDNRVLVP